ncbi:hypothetical protein HHX47_DHR5001040 [Lentinula edodes]|nr:hypothetical protein HHX47_DHR5001040 [Lentinula edodes]
MSTHEEEDVQTQVEVDRNPNSPSKYPTTIGYGEDVEKRSTRRELQDVKPVYSPMNTLDSREVVIVDWDGPDDPKNPKKPVSFWSTTIFDVAVQAVGIILLQETFAPVLLERKAQRLAKASDNEKGTGKPTSFSTIYENENRNSVFITTIPGIFTIIYGESIGIMGLNYFALGLGMVFASWMNSRTMDKIYMYFKTRNNGIGEPEYRVRKYTTLLEFSGYLTYTATIVPASIFVPVGIFMTGWAAQAHVHWFVVDMGIFFVGAGMILAFQAIQVYIVDVFTLYAASGK